MQNKKKSVVKSQITDTTKTIEERKNTKPTFSVKRIVLIVVFAIITIVVVALTIKFVLDIKWGQLFNSITNGFSHKLGILWFILLLFYFVFMNWNNYFYVWIRLKKLGYKVSIIEYWLLGFTVSFFRSVTPSFLGDSFFLVWMKANGIPTYRVTSMLFTNTLMWQIVQYVVTFPSFVMVLIYRGPLLSDPNGIAVFVLLCSGIVIDTISIVFMYLLCVSKQVHYFLSKVFNWIKKKLHMKYHTKEEIAKKYKEKAVIKQEFYAYMKDWKTTVIIFAILIIAEMMTYFAIGWAMYFVQYVHASNGSIVTLYKVSFDYWWAFNSANVTFTANRLNFLIPNGEGSIEYILRTYLTVYGKFSILPKLSTTSDLGKQLIKSVTDNSILIWRFFGAFLPSFVGLLTLIWWVIKQVQKTKKQGKFFTEEKELNTNTNTIK